MIEYLIDTNVLFAIFKGDSDIKQFVENLACGIDFTVYVECLQGSKSNREKQLIKNYLSRFPLLHATPDISRQLISLIDRYSNTHGLLLADAQIAAACLTYDLTLITLNARDFQFIQGLKWQLPK